MKIFYILYAIIHTFIIITPITAYAQVQTAPPEESNGLVPCGNRGQPECEFAHIPELFNNLIEFFLMIAVPLIAVVFMYVGFLLIQKKREGLVKAKGIIANMVIGFIVFIIGGLAVYTALVAIGAPDFITDFLK